MVCERAVHLKFPIEITVEIDKCNNDKASGSTTIVVGGLMGKFRWLGIGERYPYLVLFTYHCSYSVA